MTTTYYTPTGNPSAETRGNSSQVRAEFQAIAAAFTSASTDIAARGLIAGQTWSGTHTFPATTYGVTAAPGASGAAFATIDYVNTVATNAALPGQTSKSDYLITSNGTTASWTNTINASVVKLVDGADKTKQVQIDASGLTTATTRKIIMPDRNVLLGNFTNLAVISTTQTWTAPANVNVVEVTVVNGGQGGGNGGPSQSGGAGAATGTSILTTIVPGGSYTCTIGAGSSPGSPGAAGGASSFAGPGITTLTTSNATVKRPGASGRAAAGSGNGLGGGTALAGDGSTGYGVGGKGYDSSSFGATSGQAGVIIIRY